APATRSMRPRFRRRLRRDRRPAERPVSGCGTSTHRAVSRPGAISTRATARQTSAQAADELIEPGVREAQRTRGHADLLRPPVGVGERQPGEVAAEPGFGVDERDTTVAV